MSTINEALHELNKKVSIKEAKDLTTISGTVANCLNKNMSKIPYNGSADQIKKAVIDLLQNDKEVDQKAAGEAIRKISSCRTQTALINTMATFMTGQRTGTTKINSSIDEDYEGVGGDFADMLDETYGACRVFTDELSKMAKGGSVSKEELKGFIEHAMEDLQDLDSMIEELTEEEVTQAVADFARFGIYECNAKSNKPAINEAVGKNMQQAADEFIGAIRDAAGIVENLYQYSSDDEVEGVEEGDWFLDFEEALNNQYEYVEIFHHLYAIINGEEYRGEDDPVDFEHEED